MFNGKGLIVQIASTSILPRGMTKTLKKTYQAHLRAHDQDTVIHTLLSYFTEHLGDLRVDSI
jgi:hypothetical protein